MTVYTYAFRVSATNIVSREAMLTKAMPIEEELQFDWQNVSRETFSIKSAKTSNSAEVL